jgi:hypothetical protein
MFRNNSVRLAGFLASISSLLMTVAVAMVSENDDGIRDAVTITGGNSVS